LATAERGFKQNLLCAPSQIVAMIETSLDLISQKEKCTEKVSVLPEAAQATLSILCPIQTITNA
jgi:hypothetical protein